MVDEQAIAALQQVEIGDVSKANANEISTYGMSWAFPEEALPEEPQLVHEFLVDVAWDELWTRLLSDQAPFGLEMLKQFGNTDIVVGNWRGADGSPYNASSTVLTRTNNTSAPVPTVNLPGFPTHSPIVDFQELTIIDADSKRFRSCIFSVGVPYGRDIRILSELTYTREVLDDADASSPDTATSSASAPAIVPTSHELDATDDTDTASAPASSSSSSKKKKKKKKKKSGTASASTSAVLPKVKPYVIRVDVRYGIHFDKKPFLVSSIIRYTAMSALRKTWVDWEPLIRKVAQEFGYSALKPPEDD